MTGRVYPPVTRAMTKGAVIAAPASAQPRKRHTPRKMPTLSSASATGASSSTVIPSSWNGCSMALPSRPSFDHSVCAIRDDTPSSNAYPTSLMMKLIMALVQEVPVGREDEGDVAFVGGGDHFRVADRALRGDDGGAACVGCGEQTVGGREEAVARARRALREVVRAMGGDLHRADAVRLTRADA